MSQPSLYQRALGAEFSRLAPALRCFHSLAGSHRLAGWVEADAPASAPARLLAWCLGSPQGAHQGPLRFELDASPEVEVWTRHFPGKTMRSRLSGGPLLVEQLGPARLTFALSAADPGLVMRLVRLHFLRVPCPRWLMPRIVAEESGTGGRLNFRVHASVPVLGTVASYRGYLELPVAEDAP